MTTHTIDNFVDTNGTNLESHAPDQGGPWTKTDGTAGSYTTQSNALVEPTANADGSWTVPVGSPDMYAQVTAGTTWAQGTSSFGPCVRITDSNNFWGIRDTGGSSVDFFKRVAGTFTNITTLTGLTIAPGDIWKLSVTGNIFTIFQNGTLKYTSAADTFNNTETKAGLMYHGDASASQYIRKFESDTNNVTPSTQLFPGSAQL